MHTFHMPFRECTITLQDVAYQMGLFVDGKAVSRVLPADASDDIVRVYILTEEYSRLWRAVTSLIYFAVIEWHQVDRVVPQLDGVQHVPKPTLNIDWLHAKDDKGGDKWFPAYYQTWHLLWSNRVDYVLSIQIVVDLGDAFDRGSSQEPARVQVPDMPDNRRRKQVMTGEDLAIIMFVELELDVEVLEVAVHRLDTMGAPLVQAPDARGLGTDTGLPAPDARGSGVDTGLTVPDASPYDTWFSMGGMPPSALGVASPADVLAKL
ncbi:uncharacterized protein DS421_15g507450 [Arachis hypogaea]|nr:uncharacterized protein DS421_15g507450 [Arachis hypogaea]